MMKRLTITTGILCLVFSVYTGHVYSQWETVDNNIYNSNSGYVGVGTASPLTLLHIGKTMTEPTITVQNTGGFGGATYSMIDDASGANWKFKATTAGGFKIRDHANGMDVIVIEQNSSENAIYISNGGNVGIGTSSPESSAILDLSASNKGFLVPKMTGAERDIIPGPAEGLIIYQTDNDPGFYSFKSGSWHPIGSELFSIDDLADGKADDYSIFFGTGAGSSDDGTSNANVGLGIDALNGNISGYCNTALGYQSLYSNSTGRHNTANGYQALYFNSSGDENTATGFQALYKNSGNYNSAYGWQALHSNTTGHHNTGVGYGALQYNTLGYFNTGIGHNTLNNNTIGLHNTGLGFQPLAGNTTGSNNTGCGSHASNANTIGDNNTSIGYYANYFNQEGSNNTVIGCDAGRGTAYHNKSGNVFLGYRAGYYETASNKLYIDNSDTVAPLIYGDFENDKIRVNGILEVSDAYQFPSADGTAGQVLQTNGGGVVNWVNVSGGGATDIDDLTDGISDGNSVYLGLGAGINDDATSNENVAVGKYALNANTSGWDNTAIGYEALSSNIDGTSNTASGYWALRDNSDGVNNSAFGAWAAYLNTSGASNTAIGVSANARNLEGSYNTIVGYEAGRGTGPHNKTGNVFLGFRAGYYEMTDNKLYIANSDTQSPLIYGEFDNNILTINGSLGIGTKTPDEKLEIEFNTENSDIEFGQGITDPDVTFFTLRSPNGTKFYITVDNSGNFVSSTAHP